MHSLILLIYLISAASFQVKKDRKTGQSKGFGFIRYAAFESQRRALAHRHVMDWRVVDLKISSDKVRHWLSFILQCGVFCSERAVVVNVPVW